MTFENEFDSYCNDEYSDNSDQFKTWLKEVDRLIANELGLGVFDLPDRLWRDMFDSEMDTIEAAEEVIENPWND